MTNRTTIIFRTGILAATLFTAERINNYMANEKRYYHKFQETDHPETWGHIQNIISGGIDEYGADCIYIPMEGRNDPTLIDTVFGEMKQKSYHRGYGMRMLLSSSLELGSTFNFSHFGYMEFNAEQIFYTSIREFFQRMRGWDDVTETSIIDGTAPTGYSEADILDVHPNVGDLIWLPIFNTMYTITLCDNKENVFFAKYSIYKMTCKKMTADPARQIIDITSSAGQGLEPGALDIAPDLPKINDIQNTETLTPNMTDPTVTGNDHPDLPPLPINKNIEIESDGVNGIPGIKGAKDVNKLSDIFGDF